MIDFILIAMRAVGVFALARRLRRPRVIVLCYHGFSSRDEHQYNPWLFMRAQTFARRLELLSALGLRVVSLSDAVAAIRGEAPLEHDIVALTFDDGWHGLLKVALPLLRRHEYPATVYVTTYYVVHELPIVNLMVRYMFWKTRRTELPLGTLGMQSESALRLVDSADRDIGSSLAQEIIENLPVSERRAALGRLAEALGLDWEDMESAMLMRLVDPAGARALREGGMSLQLHTHRHLGGRTLGDEALLREEITRNRDHLARITSEPLVHYCYPSGAFDPRQEPWLDDLGIESATTTVTGLNRPGANVYQLSRILDRESLSDTRFLAEISGFFDIVRNVRRALVQLTS